MELCVRRSTHACHVSRESCDAGTGKEIMFAVIKSGGRQYKVAVGEEVRVNRLPVDAGDQVRIAEVLLISDAGNTRIGSPLVSNALVLATATEHGRGEKLIVFKYKSKKRYRHKRGHRQELTFLSIDDIVADGKSLITGNDPEFREKVVPSEEAVEVTSVTATTEETSGAESAEETSQPEAEKKSRRRRTVKAEDSETKAEE
jgi:large subunit ribosomal protein L21